MPSRAPRFAALIVIVALVSDCRADHPSRFSVVNERHRSRREHFAPKAPPLALEKLISIGGLEGPDDRVFGQIAAAVFGRNHEIVVADARLQRIVVYNPDGSYRRTIGKVGQGPGEFVEPVALALLDDTLFVYDGRQGRISAFNYDGSFIRAFPPPTTLISVLEPGPKGTLLAAVNVGSSPIIQMTTTGEVVARYLSQPSAEKQAGPTYTPEAGSFCVQDSTIIYLNPWIYELVRLGIADGAVHWSRLYESDVLRPLKSIDPVIGAFARGGGTIGLACNHSFLVASYIDRESPRSIIDFLTPDGSPLGRLVFDREADRGQFPGVIADEDEDLLLTYRNRPFPVVMTWRVVPTVSASR